MICKKSHRYDEKFKDLPDDQSAPNRHRCAGCAYELGVKSVKEGGPAHLSPDELPFSQADQVRHKSPQAAFEMGRTAALKIQSK